MDAIKINSNKIDKIKYDCFAWNEAHNCCNALSEVLCQTRTCPFYKTCFLYLPHTHILIINLERSNQMKIF